MNQLKIDGHKLTYHIPRVNSWLNGDLIYPIYMEISPSGMCNHRCRFCALDFMGYKKSFLDADILAERFQEMGKLGVKSIMFGGEGEPLLHKRIGWLTQQASLANLDVAFTTNGVFLDKKKVHEILPHTEWIKVSCNAGTPGTYGTIHGTKAADFKKVIANLSYAAKYREKNNLSCVLGLQLLLLPENRQEVTTLASIARDIGIDYLVIKPYSHHPSSTTEYYRDISYEDSAEECAEAELLSTTNFSVIARLNTMKSWDTKSKTYTQCLGLPFWSYIDSAGNVWGCSAHLEDKKFLYGNIFQQNFQEIWEGEKRLDLLAWFDREFDASTCRLNCRMDKINHYLWELRHPPQHVNFI